MKRNDKKHKIKRYSHRRGFAPRPSKAPWKVILAVVAAAALIFVGISAYEPVTRLLQGRFKPSPRPEPELSEPEVSQPPESATPTPEPDPEPEPEPQRALYETLRAKHLPADIAKDPATLATFLDGLPEGYNSVLLETKTNQGIITYNTQNQQAKDWGGVVEDPIDLNALKTTLAARDMQLLVKMSVFSDPIAARGDIERNAIYHSSGMIWLDNTLANGGKPWTTPFSAQVREYNVALAKEMSDLGADLIILDHLQIPNDPSASAVLGSSGESTRGDALVAVETAMQEQISTSRIAVYFTYGSASADEGTLSRRYGGAPSALVQDMVVLDTSGEVLFGDGDSLSQPLQDVLTKLNPEQKPVVLIAREGQLEGKLPAESVIVYE